MLVLAIISAVVLLVSFALARNYVQAETRGTVPLERLAHRGSALERSLARTIADSLHRPALGFQDQMETLDRLVKPGKIRGTSDPRSLIYMSMSARVEP